MKRSVGFFMAAVVLGVAGIGCGMMQSCPIHRALFPSKPAAAPADAAVQQTTCPVMGGKIDPKLFTDYKGTRVYFCCPGCVDKFMKDPEKYFAKVQNQGA